MYIYSVLYAFDDRTVNDSFTSFIRVLPAEGHPPEGECSGTPRTARLVARSQNTKNENKQKRIKRKNRVKRKIE